MEILKHTIKYCSIFPNINYTEENLQFSLKPLAVAPEIINIKLSGAWKRLNVKGQLTGHNLQSIIKRKNEFKIYHSESFDIGLFMIADFIEIEIETGQKWIFKNLTLSQNISQGATYVTTFIGEIYNEKNEVCNVNSNFVHEKNLLNANNLVNKILCKNENPSYTAIFSKSIAGSTSPTFFIKNTEKINNIEIGHYLYLHGDFDEKFYGIDTVVCISKTANSLEFEGDSTLAVGSRVFENELITLNFEITDLENENVISVPLITEIYTDFEPKLYENIKSSKKIVETGQGKLSDIDNIVQNSLKVPFVVSESEQWKTSELQFSELVKFETQEKTYFSISNDKILETVKNDNLLNYRQYFLNLIYETQIINNND